MAADARREDGSVQSGCSVQSGGRLQSHLMLPVADNNSSTESSPRELFVVARRARPDAVPTQPVGAARLADAPVLLYPMSDTDSITSSVSIFVTVYIWIVVEWSAAHLFASFVTVTVGAHDLTQL